MGSYAMASRHRHTPGTPNAEGFGSGVEKDEMIENVSVKFGVTHKWTGASETKGKNLTLE